MHRRWVDNNQLIVVEETVQLTCSLVTIFCWSWTYKLLWHSKNVSDRCWPECGVLISSTSYSGFYLSLVQLIAWAEDTYISSTLRFPYCVFDTEKFILSKWWEHTAGNSWRRVWWRGYTLLWVLGIEMHRHCEDNDPICSSCLSESFVMRCFGLVRTTPTSSSSWSTDHTFDLGLCLLLLWRTTTFFDNFDCRLRTMRLWFTLWISYYSGRKTTAIQLYLADLHWECGTECLTST